MNRPTLVALAVEAISAEQLAWDLAVLASDDYRGRHTPSPGFDAAADYITARLARAGIHDRYHLPADEARALDPVQAHAVARTVFTSLWMLADAAERPRIDQPIPNTVPRHR